MWQHKQVKSKSVEVNHYIVHIARQNLSAIWAKSLLSNLTLLNKIGNQVQTPQP